MTSYKSSHVFFGKVGEPGFQFCINRWQHTHFRSDFLVLLCYNRKREVVAAYVIPGQHVNGNHKIVIPTVAYRGKWYQWLDAWENILTHPEVEYERATRKRANE